MMQKKFVVRFKNKNQRVMLKKSRAFVDSVCDGLRILQGENWGLDGSIYVIVEGLEEDLVGDLSRLGEEAVTFSAVGSIHDLDDFQCIGCDNRSDGPFFRCPACGAAEIAPCPSCSHEVKRQEYLCRGNYKWSCPRCMAPVYLTLGSPTGGPAILVLPGVP